MGWFGRLFSSSSAQDVEEGGGFRAARPSFGGRNLAADNAASALPRFHGSATDQLHSRGGPEEKARIRLRDAFTPSQPVSNIRMFAGRTDVLKSLIRSIEDQRMHLVLYGDRGMGKTSMMHILAQLAREAKYVVCYASCGEDSDFSDIFRTIAADIPLLYHSGYAPTDAAIEQGKTLADLLPPGPVSASQLSELFGKLSSTRVLIILDEFDRSPPGAFRRGIAELIKNLSDRSVRVQLAIAGVAGNLAELIEHIPSIRRNIYGLQVPNMKPDEVEELIHIGEGASGLTFEEDALQFLVSISYGSPYIASLLAQHAGLNAVDRGALDVTHADVAMAVRASVEEIRHRVSERSVDQVETARADGHLEMLALLARISLTSGGRLDLARMEGTGPKAADCERFITDVASRYALIEPMPGDVPQRYRFREEGVPVFIWMLLARDHLSEPGAARAAGV